MWGEKFQGLLDDKSLMVYLFFTKSTGFYNLMTLGKKLWLPKLNEELEAFLSKPDLFSSCLFYNLL